MLLRSLLIVDHIEPPPYERTYTDDEFRSTVAHEMGHVFGLGDAYGENTYSSNEEIPAGGWLIGDRMYENGNATSNDVEMLLEAWKLNNEQGFKQTDPSAVIRLR